VGGVRAVAVAGVASVRRPSLREGFPAMLGRPAPAAELAARPAAAPLKQLPPVRWRSALRARAGPPALLGTAQAPPRPPPPPWPDAGGRSSGRHGGNVGYNEW